MSLLEQLSNITEREAAEHAKLKAEYAAILSRPDKPEPKDADRVKKLATLLDYSTDDLQADVEAAVEAVKTRAGIPAEAAIAEKQKLAAEAYDAVAAAEIECREKLQRLHKEHRALGIDARFTVELKQQAKDKLEALREARPNAFTAVAEAR